MYADDQAWVVHLLVFGTDAWAVNSYVWNSVFQKKNLFWLFQKPNEIGHEINTYQCTVALFVVLRCPLKYTNDVIAYRYELNANIYVTY